ncbi:carbon starvation CstA family protein [Coraliomargarita akajimensis]|uniref:Carbon starvation protein CstA n=1 Tax=Coraliomargarita akajimensis (strain DSM 45221 / IAM 15411 / JCM 23193 / KCTC 12865 / 04OKA010-24) TaxID=583355 RepID=D5EK31_CORAD|nr:carbon starvation CstA family protein [Coraliomargarita akajimensis]ADE54780.1 carbon starvation protein CstA [Coraliomargarita akajimensis DSM 45221]
MLLALLLLSSILLIVAYRFYGVFLEKRCRIEPERETPACEINDGVDYVPTRASVLFGHHFSSIAGAGPIVGPIIAASVFGWLPTWIWIIIGSIFVGGVHDFGSTLMSLRYGGRSITSTCRKLVGETTGKLFLIFVLLALVYVIVVFLDLTVAGFVKQPAVATASGWFIVVALAFGLVARKSGISYKIVIPAFVLLTYLGMWVGVEFPATGVSKNVWMAAVLVYCYCAAILPVSVLMQPRDFLSATFLYAIMLLGVVGLFAHGGGFELPVYTSFAPKEWHTMVPFLFITVACGACSGFHSIVSSGTTSKQIQTEKDVKKVSYGAMLVEGLLAVFALACIGVVGSMDGGPVATFSKGAAVFFSALHIPLGVGETFATLAVSTFLLTTLDTCTRLTRFLVEELFDWRGASSRYLGTLLVLALPAVAAFGTFTAPDGTVLPVWKAIWPLFGSTNQLLAALALITFVVFLKHRRIAFGFAIVPAAVMAVMPIAGLVMMVFQHGPFSMLGGIALAMVLLGLYVTAMSVKFVLKDNAVPEGAEA